MITPKHVENAGLTLFGIALVIGVVILLLGAIDNATNKDTQKENTRRTQIEACASIEDDAVRSLCINGEGR